jgi:hypothetical protein
VVLGLVAVLFAVLIAVDAGSDSSSSSSAATKLREQVLAAAKQCAAQVNSYDYRQLDQSEAKAKACATGKYLADYTGTFDKIIRKKAPGLKATQSLQIDVGGVENVSEDGKTWTVLLFGQVKSVNTGTSSTGRFEPEAIQVTMTKVGSKWLISELIGA